MVNISNNGIGTNYNFSELRAQVSVQAYQPSEQQPTLLNERSGGDVFMVKKDTTVANKGTQPKDPKPSIWQQIKNFFSNLSKLIGRSPNKRESDIVGVSR